jgi:hypothetical protein
MGLVGILVALGYEGLSLELREWLEDMASYRLFIEPYLQRVTHDDLELYVRILLAAVRLAKEKYSVVTLIPHSKNPGYLEGRVSAITRSFNGCRMAAPWSWTFL